MADPSKRSSIPSRRPLIAPPHLGEERVLAWANHRLENNDQALAHGSFTDPTRYNGVRLLRALWWHLEPGTDARWRMSGLGVGQLQWIPGGERPTWPRAIVAWAPLRPRSGFRLTEFGFVFASRVVPGSGPGATGPELVPAIDRAVRHVEQGRRGASSKYGVGLDRCAAWTEARSADGSPSPWDDMLTGILAALAEPAD